MSATSSTRQGAGASPARMQSYKVFLTPALHRAFTNAASIGLGLCWAEATLMSSPNLLWSWFPFGMTGLRTGLLFVSCLTIFVLRVAYMHIGERTGSMGAAGIFTVLLTPRSLWTIVWYSVSAFLFSETYLFSMNPDSNLAWVDSARSYERPRLNERAVLFRSLFAILAYIQALLHILRDYDALIPAEHQSDRAGSSHKADSSESKLLSLTTIDRLRAAAPAILIRSIALTIQTGVFGPIIYFLLLRKVAWTASLRIAKIFYTMQKSQSPTGLTDVFALFGRYVICAFLLIMLWEATNTVFSIYAAQAPLKKGQPLTNDALKPNESLVSGLKAKKDIPHAMALWELRLIAEQYETRRMTIFNDFEKLGASTWLDVLESCLNEIQTVRTSIQATLAPAPAQQSQSQNVQQPQKARLTQPLQDNPQIFRPSQRPTSTLETIAANVGAAAKSIGQSPSSGPLTTKTRQYLDPNASNPNASKPVPMAKLLDTAWSYAIDALRTPLGVPFRMLFRDRINAIVFGSPYSNATNLSNAVRALSQLTAHSLREDNFGQAQKDVARILAALTGTITDIQTLTRTLPPHWTDVWFSDSDRQVSEVEELLATLRKGLETIVLSFGEYADALGISRAELARAKQLTGKSDEMVKR